MTRICALKHSPNWNPAKRGGNRSAVGGRPGRAPGQTNPYDMLVEVGQSASRVDWRT